MNNIVIFSGTTEGRRLSDMLSAAEIRHVVCVASEYGREMMEENPYASVRVGRMDAEEMKAFFSEVLAGTAPGEGESDRMIVVDATHPYATEVTANIREAAAARSLRYLRVVRAAGDGDPESSVYADIVACAKALENTSGNILLTTGSKELCALAGSISDRMRGRIYARVLPTSESIRLCEEAGIEPDHIIAMQGPFRVEMNEAIFRQYDIRHLVTKESGAAGGFPEKAEAAARANVCMYVIARPEETEGISVEEAYRILNRETDLLDPSDMDEEKRELQITLVGLGMGSADCMTVAAGKALRESDAVFGAKRLLKGIAHPRKYEMYLASDMIPVLEREQFTSAAVVFSGDTGFCSGAKGMLKALREWREDLNVRVLPGISSFAYLAAKLGESYDDAILCSVHGKNTVKDLHALVETIRYHTKVFTLLSGPDDVPVIAGMLLEQGMQGRMIIGTDLSYENETIREFSIAEATACKDGADPCFGAGPATLLILNEAPERRLLIPVKRDDDFIRDNVPMTKACIRHESILRLNLREGDVFYDIGGGTGSVAIEAASLHGSLTVTTFEKKPEAVSLIRRNIEKAGLCNVSVIEGPAEETLHDMPKPDCVFIGGSSGKIKEILEILHEKGSGIRFVITAVSMETSEEVRALMKQYASVDAETLMLQVSNVNQIGSHHMMQAENPVWIFAFTA